MTKFKSGDLVENIHTGDVEMISKTIPMGRITFFYLVGYGRCTFSPIHPVINTVFWRKLSYKDVKFKVK